MRVGGAQHVVAHTNDTACVGDAPIQDLLVGFLVALRRTRPFPLGEEVENEVNELDVRQIRDLLEFEPSNLVGGAGIEGRPELTVHVDGIEDDPDHVSGLAGSGLVLREPAREDANDGAKCHGEPCFLVDLAVSCRFRRLAPVHSATRHRPLPVVGMTRRGEPRQQQTPGRIATRDVRRRPSPLDIHRIRMPPTRRPS